MCTLAMGDRSLYEAGQRAETHTLHFHLSSRFAFFLGHGVAGTMDSGSSPFSDLDSYVRALQGKRAIKKVLIANNGIAAVKAIRFLRKWSYEVFGNEHEVRVLAEQGKLGRMRLAGCPARTLQWARLGALLDAATRAGLMY